MPRRMFRFLHGFNARGVYFRHSEPINMTLNPSGLVGIASTPYYLDHLQCLNGLAEIHFLLARGFVASRLESPDLEGAC